MSLIRPQGNNGVRKEAVRVPLNVVKQMFREAVGEKDMPGNNMEEFLNYFLKHSKISLSKIDYEEVLKDAYQEWEGEVFENLGGAAWIVEDGTAKSY